MGAGLRQAGVGAGSEVQPGMLMCPGAALNAIAGCALAAAQVIADDTGGLLFKSKRDRKVLRVAPGAPPGDNTCRTVLATQEYLQVVLFDHVTRRRS